MELQLNIRHGFELIFTAENVNVCEDIEERVYGKTEDGKTNYRDVERDIKTDAINTFASILEDMIYYRKADFDSSNLIERLFEKLPEEVCNKLIEKLKRDYEE